MQQPIIVFDSGRGGRSIYDPLRAALPAEDLLYIDDHENFPYGDKSAVWLTTRFKELATTFASYNPRLVVLACNTATVNAVDELRQLLSCPVVGVEPVIKPLAQYDRALVLMTEASAKAEKTAELMKQYGQHLHIYTPHGLATAIEYNDIDQMKKIIHEIKNSAQEERIQAIGLSCTHYPLVIAEFRASMPDVVFIDPSSAVVDQVLRVLRSSHHE